MPTITTEGSGYDFGRALLLLSGLDQGVVTASSATDIVVSWDLGFLGIITWTLTGSALTTRIINGVTYIDGGTVDSIAIDEGAGVTYSITGLALAGVTLRQAWRADQEGTNPAALENLFRAMTWSFTSGNGRANPSDHQVGGSFDVPAILPTGNNNYLLGSGDDVVSQAGSGNDTVFGGNGADTLSGNDGNDLIYGEFGADSLYGGRGNDRIYGYTPLQLEFKGSGADVAFGGDGNDWVEVNEGSVYGGIGNDTVTGNRSTGSVLFGDEGADTIRIVGGTAYGGSGNDFFQSISPVSSIGYTGSGDAGNDTMNGGEWRDTLSGGTGSDVVSGNGGEDALNGDGGNDSMYGGSSEDVLYGGTGNDLLSGGAGNDAMYGGEGNDTLTADESPALGEILDGGEGNDRLTGGVQADAMLGGEGSDTLAGGAGADTMNGGEGVDLLSYADAAVGVTVSLTSGAGTGGDAAGDVLSGFENVLGSAHADAITGDANPNLLTGGNGNDTLDGLGSNDTLSGGQGDDSLSGGTGDDSLSGGGNNDVLLGGSGNDTLTGGAGVDVMTGNSGSDLFLFLAVTETGNTTPDVITDFVSGVDVVSLAGLGLTFVTGAFTAANQIRWDEATSRLQIETNGYGVTDRQIELTGVGVDFVRATDLLL